MRIEATYAFIWFYQRALVGHRTHAREIRRVPLQEQAAKARSSANGAIATPDLVVCRRQVSTGLQGAPDPGRQHHDMTPTHNVGSSRPMR